MSKWVICSGTDWYRPSYSSTKQIMDEFYREGYSVLYVNPIPFKSAGENSINRKSAVKKILNKFKTHLNVFRKINNRFFVFVPLYFPAFNPRVEKFNERFIKFQISLLRTLLGINKDETVLWISGSFTLMGELKNNYYKKVYEAADLISDFRTNNINLKDKLRVKETELSNKSDIIFACTDMIASKLTAFTDKQINMLYHGVDFDHFNKRQKIANKILDIKKRGLPVAGYFGSLSDTANDLRMFEILAKNNFSVVLIGKPLGDFSELNKLENIHLLGPINYNILPSYGHGFDLCFMSWRQHEWLNNCYPIKTLEYLAMGKPIVSVPIPVIEKLFGSLIYTASTPEEFLHQAQRALSEDSEELRLKRINAVRNYDWSGRFDIIKSKLNGDNSYMEEKYLNENMEFEISDMKSK
ncbi:MAG: glycosyltransferase [Ignavibacteriaceae bacterium]